MFHLFQAFPTPPPQLVDLFKWLLAPETLFALFLLYLKIPLIKEWPDWKKGAVFVVVATILAGLVVGLSMVLTPELLDKAQPFYAPFVILLNLVLGYYGFQAIKRPISRLWDDTLLIRRARAAADVGNRLGRAPDEDVIKELLAPRGG